MKSAGLSDDVILKVVPLGGLGQIGANMMAYETGDDLIVVDCGVLFPSAEQPGVDYVIPDVSYLVERRRKLRAFVITHGHEDHIGALPFVLPELDAPVYATRFTMGLIETKLGEYPEIKPRLHEIRDSQPFVIGEFTIEPIPVTHSIPDAVTLAIQTPAGLVVHTGDFKLDPHPVDGRLTDEEALRRAGERGVLALFSDSTNAERDGHTWSEREVGEELGPLIESARGRVLVTAFASNIHRVQLVIEASERAGRKVILVGRSMQQNVQLAVERGLLRARHGVFAELDDFADLPRDGVTIIAAGSQGEPQSSMVRIAGGQHTVRIEPKDRVIFSSRRIPGNERAIGRMINSLYRLGAEVVDDRNTKVHTSGHAMNDEQRRMIELCRPRFFVPMHGEYRHLVRHARLAEATGVPAQTLVVEDGQPVEFVREGDGIGMRRGEPIKAGHVFVDGFGVGDVQEVVLRDRRLLAETGIVICVVILDEHGQVAAGPDLITRGVVHVDENQPLLRQVVQEVREALSSRRGSLDVAEAGELLRQTLRRFFRRELDRRPLIVPVVMSL